MEALGRFTNATCKLNAPCQNIEIGIGLFCGQRYTDILSYGLSFLPLNPSVQRIDSRIANDQAFSRQ
jgi:hypothetical protein